MRTINLSNSRIIQSILLLIALAFFPSTTGAQDWVQLGIDIDGEAENDFSGTTVSLSTDGSTLAIGAAYNQGNGLNAGHVRVFKLLAGEWTQLGEDIDGEAPSDESGFSVSLSADGSAVAIGARKNSETGPDAGHVRVYKFLSEEWIQLGEDMDGEAEDDLSGWSVSLSGDGLTVAIGAPDNEGNGLSTGHVRVYKFLSEEWTQLGSDIDGETTTSASGWALSLSSDGLTIAIGAINNSDIAVFSGEVKVYKFLSEEWTQQGADINGEAEGDNSGNAISLSADGLILAIGAYKNDGNGQNAGHVRVYQFSLGEWTQQGEDINGEAAGDQSGTSVSLSANGLTLAIGAHQNTGNGMFSGHVRVFQFLLGEWTQQGDDIDGEAIGDFSGQAISLSADGSTVAIGAQGSDENGPNSGHVRVFSQVCPGTASTLDIAVCESIISPSGDFTWSASGTYVDVIENVNGCDSTITVNLTIQNSFATDVRMSCEPFTWIDENVYSTSNTTATHIIPNAAGCDSLITLNLTINQSTSSTDVQTACEPFTWIDENVYSTSNTTATHIIPNAVGCDSLITLNLTINQSTSSTDVQTACEPFTWIDENVYSTSNTTATHIIPNAAGCDSLITLNLTINQSTSSTDVQTSCGPFTWIDENVYDASNSSATYVIPNAVGCDSLITLDLTVYGPTTITLSGNTLTADVAGLDYQWVDCDADFEVIDGETNQTFNPIAGGNYAVITNNGFCTYTSDCVNVLLVGIDSSTFKDAISLYPNPTTGNFSINLGSHLRKIEYQIINPLGEVVQAQSGIETTLLNLNIEGASGLYLVILSSGNENTTLRIVKE
ncbi:MAG: hypothetical protein ACJAQ5_002133 [Flavobacteriales bacterium]|jgi:hypothetical protein